MNDHHDGELDAPDPSGLHSGLVDELAECLRARIDDELAERPPAPDVEAMLARAREIDPRLGDQLDEPGAPEPDVFGTVDIGHERRDREALRPFVEAYATKIDAQVEERRMRPLPAAPTRPRRPVVWASASLAAAAALVLAIVGSGTLTREGSAVEAGEAASQASDQARTSSEPRAATRIDRSRRTSGSAAVSLAPGPSSVIEPTAPSAVPEPTPSKVSTEPATKKKRPRPTQGDAPEPETKPTVAPSLEDRIAALDAEAQSAWRAGSMGEAETKFREITRIGGLRRSVEVAFGELFSLVRQRSSDPRPIWREYLGRFPKGIYAEDAQAGLCRRATGAERERCWSQYRERFPSGMHAPEDASPQ